MTNKIALYSHILHFGIIHLKNYISMPVYKKMFCEKEKYISELIHLIPRSLYSDTYNQADIYFVNNEVRRFISEYPDKSDYTFTMIVDALLSLYDEIHIISPLLWEFPDELRNLIENKKIDNNI